ncbi:MAG: CopG family transcriptional regulator [Pseudanabaena frigida]|uniref:CopG family transcriptional regulator n=1 Tax=Pseudanabaena frigida TaxID=945775 RepID=A0A2W4W4P9_9CYAN|nr:MAG: CopG family transcriptional regulator [Pseudanabaena frigida]
MKPIIIYLSPKNKQVLEQLSVQGGKTPSEIIQEAFELYVVNKKKILPKCVGVGKSGIADLSERVDELLWQ